MSNVVVTEKPEEVSDLHPGGEGTINQEDAHLSVYFFQCYTPI